jgi:polysaccharide pyruvyl transferase WcaK-like protein
MFFFKLRAGIDRNRFPEKFERLREYATYLLKNQPAIAYIGAIGYANLGDIALYASIRSSFKNTSRFVSFREDSLVKLFGVLNGSVLYNSICLGGGTLIGQKDKMLALERALNSGLVGFSYGTGVADPIFEAEKQKNFPREFRGYFDTLRRLSLISVRDQRSKDILIENGFEHEIYVIGDPVLSMSFPMNVQLACRGSIGINLGISKVGQWGNLHNTSEILIEVARELLRKKYEIKIFPMSWIEYEMAHEVATKLGKGVHVEERYLDPEAVLISLSQQDIVIGVKLHTAIMAHTANVPAIMLAYEPKCISYMQSMDMDEFTIRADLISADLILERLCKIVNIREKLINGIVLKKKFFLSQQDAFRQKVLCSLLK